MTTQRTSGPRARPSPLRNVAANWGAFLVSTVINFWLSPQVVRGLGDTAYGLWVLLASLVGYMGLLDLGVRGAVTRYIARHHAAHEDEDSSRIASAALSIFSLAGAVTIAVSGVLAVAVPHAFSFPPEFVHAARIVVVLGGVTIALSLIGGVYGGAVAGLQRFDVLSSTEIIAEITRAALVLTAIRSGAGLIALALIQLGVAAARGITFYVTARQLYPELRIAFRGWGREDLRQIFSFSLFSSAIQFSGMIVYYTSSVIIGAMLPVHEITFYAIGSNLTSYARTVVSAISQPVTPRISALERGHDTPDLANVVLDTGRLAALALLPITITFLLRGGSFIGLWMGPSYATPSGRVLIILSLSLLAGAGRNVIFSALMGLNRHRRLVPYYAVEAAVNLLMCLLLVRPLGIEGAAWAMTLPNLALSLFVLPRVLQRELGATLSRTWMAHLVRPIGAMLPFAAASYAFEHYAPASSLLMYFMQVGAALPAAFIGAWVVGMSPPERRALQDRLASQLGLKRPGVSEG